MRIDVVTLFKSMFEGPLTESIVGRARAAGLVEIGFVDPRDFADDRRRTVDGRPYGGGAGMVLMAQPLYAAVKSVAKRQSRVVHLSASGRPFDAEAALRLSRSRHLILVCGHYEGVDERVSGLFDEEISIGDFVVTGGELPAMVVADAVTRLVPGVLPEGAAIDDSFLRASGILEHPHYTRPRVWRGKRVPQVLLSGNHAAIERWRDSAAVSRTRRRRPQLLQNLL